jgi:hypothetical protein
MKHLHAPKNAFVTGCGYVCQGDECCNEVVGTYSQLTCRKDFWVSVDRLHNGGVLVRLCCTLRKQRIEIIPNC